MITRKSNEVFEVMIRVELKEVMTEESGEHYKE